MADHSLTLTLSDGRCWIPGGGISYMAYTGMSRWTGYAFFNLSVLNRVYNAVRVCQQGIARTNDLICWVNFYCTPSIRNQ